MPHRTLYIAFVFVFALGFTPMARAHHGLDFLLVQDAYIPESGELTLYGGFDWARQGAADFYSTEPGAMIGLLPGIGFGIGSEISDNGDGWAAYSLSPYLQAQILPTSWTKRVRVALRFGYDFSLTPYESTVIVPVTITRQVTKPGRPMVHTTTTNAGGGGSSNPPCSGPDCVNQPQRHAGHGPHTTTTTVTTSKPTVTNETITVFEKRQKLDHVEGFNSRLIIEADLTGTDRLALNLTYFGPSHGVPQFGYAAGLRHAFTHDFAMSLEALGTFDDDNWHEAVLGVHMAVSHHVTLKLGASVGLTPETPDFALHTGFVLRF